MSQNAYVIEYELCALLFLIVVTIRFCTIRKFPSRLNKLFTCILFGGIIDIVLDVVASYLINNQTPLPIWVYYAINTMFYLMQILLALSVLIYVINMCGRGRAVYRFIWFLPASVCFFALTINPFFHIIFSIVQDGDRILFSHGFMFNLLYIVSTIYMALTIIVILIYRRRITKVEFFTIISFVELVVVAILIQAFLPNVLLIGVAFTIAILMMFFTLQNPEAMLNMVSGVYNFGTLNKCLEYKIKDNEKLLITAVDIGGMRRINGNYGVGIGNDVIHSIGDFLNKTCAGKALVFHMIGIRFLVVAKEHKNQNEIINAINERFKKPWKCVDDEVMLTATIIFSEESKQYASPEEIINLIDLAYNRGNSQDIGTTRPISSEIIDMSRRKAMVEEALRRALATGEGLSLNFQPIYSINSKQFNSAEVLLRLNDKKLGKISPAEFIPIAENIGVISRVDNYVVEKASNFLRKHSELLEVGFKCLEINLSGAEFYQDTIEFSKNILSKIKDYEKYICFEVTETAATLHEKLLLNFMKSLIAEGVKFAVDDFGTGYANINQIVQLPFSTVKIDRSLIISELDRDRIILEDLIKMFNKIGLNTIIEGVETEMQASLSAKMQVNEIQGFHYSVPLCEDEFVRFILQKNA